MVLQILGCSRPCCPCHRNFLAVVQPRELFVLDPSSKTLLDYFTWIIVFRKSIVNNRLQFLKQTIQPLRRKSGVTLKKEMRLVRPEINSSNFFGFAMRPHPHFDNPDRPVALSHPRLEA